MTAPELQSFHLGIVVRDIDKTVTQYSAMFDIERWFRSPHPFKGLEIAYGLGPGISLELFEVTASGDSHIHQFYAQHGEGANHLGIWTEDVARAARKAIDAGAELLSISADAEGNATAYLIPYQDVSAEHFANLGLVTFVKPSGGVLVEYVGHAGEEFMRNWFKDEFEYVVKGPPWSVTGTGLLGETSPPPSSGR